MAHEELGIEERRRIERAMNAGMPVAEIARSLGRHRSTVYREIKPNRGALYFRLRLSFYDNGLSDGRSWE
jgi:IS30 family transposase